MADGFPVDLGHAPVEVVSISDGLDVEVGQVTTEVLRLQDGLDVEVAQIAVEVLREPIIIIPPKGTTMVNIIM